MRVGELETKEEEMEKKDKETSEDEMKKISDKETRERIRRERAEAKLEQTIKREMKSEEAVYGLSSEDETFYAEERLSRKTVKAIIPELLTKKRIDELAEEVGRYADHDAYQSEVLDKRRTYLKDADVKTLAKDDEFWRKKRNKAGKKSLSEDMERFFSQAGESFRVQTDAVYPPASLLEPPLRPTKVYHLPQPKSTVEGASQRQDELVAGTQILAATTEGAPQPQSAAEAGPELYVLGMDQANLQPANEEFRQRGPDIESNLNETLVQRADIRTVAQARRAARRAQRRAQQTPEERYRRALRLALTDARKEQNDKETRTLMRDLGSAAFILAQRPQGIIREPGSESRSSSSAVAIVLDQEDEVDSALSSGVKELQPRDLRFEDAVAIAIAESVESLKTGKARVKSVEGIQRAAEEELGPFTPTRGISIRENHVQQANSVALNQSSSEVEVATFRNVGRDDIQEHDQDAEQGQHEDEARRRKGKGKLQ